MQLIKKRFYNISILFLLVLFCTFVYYFLFVNPIINLNVFTNFNFEKSNFNQEVYIQKETWNLSIPKLNLYEIPIFEGVEDVTLENYIGHFPSSSYVNGNICLAAHNAGFPKNYFKDLNTLEVGDEIIYEYMNITVHFNVIQKEIISSKDFSFLKLQDKNCITLITCINSSPLERLCVKAIIKEEM